MNAKQRRKAKRLIDRTDFTGFGYWELQLWMKQRRIGFHWGKRHIENSNAYVTIRETIFPFDEYYAKKSA